MVLDEPAMHQEFLEIRSEVNESNQVNDNNKKYIKMRGATFKDRFKIKHMKSVVVGRLKRLSDEHDLEVTVKSGTKFGTQEDDDWIVFTLNPVIPPQDEWFYELLARDYESESEVSTYFIAPLLDKLGYDYIDISMEYPVVIYRGKSHETKKADFVVFNGQGRDKEYILLIVEAKINDIKQGDIEQHKSYALALKPAYYAITNGKKLIVFRFNGIVHDSKVMEFDVSMLKENWKDLYRCISKDATICRKLEMENRFSK